MKNLFILVVAIMFIGVGVGTAICDDTKEDYTIPNFTIEDSMEDTNGRPAHLDNEVEPDQLNPVERTILIIDTIKSNDGVPAPGK